MPKQSQPSMTPGDHTLLIAAWQSITPNPKPDYHLLASRMGYKNAAVANATFWALKKKLLLDSELVVEKARNSKFKRRALDDDERANVKIEEATEKERAKTSVIFEAVHIVKQEDSVESEAEKPTLTNLDLYDYSDYPSHDIPVDVETERLRALLRSDYPNSYPEESSADNEHAQDGDEEVSGGRAVDEIPVRFADVEFDGFPGHGYGDLANWDAEDEDSAVEFIVKGAEGYLMGLGEA